MAEAVGATTIRICDTTLRDGEQAPGFAMDAGQKLAVARRLVDAGVDLIDAGFASACDAEFASIRAIARQVRGVQVGCVARARPDDLERAAAALEGADDPVLLTFVSTSDLHLEQKLGWTRTRAVEVAAKAVGRARELVGNVYFAAEDSTRSDHGFLAEVFSAAIAAGATTIGVADTVGYALPHEMAELVRYLRATVDGIDRVTLSAHCHDDLGLAVANALAAVGAGARQVDCTVNGIGERAGNAALEEFVMVLRTREIGFRTRIDSTQLYPLSRLVEAVTGEVPQANKAIIGRNAFAHEAGIHQAGVLKNPLTYEIMTPESVGRTRPPLALGKHSGRQGLRARLEHLGYDLGADELDQAYRAFLRLAETKRIVVDDDLVGLVDRGLAGLARGNLRGGAGAGPGAGRRVPPVQG